MFSARKFHSALTIGSSCCSQAGCCVAALADRWWLAGILGAAASATRAQGVLLVAFLIVLCFQKRRGWFSILLVPCGLAAFCVFLWRITGNPFAFAGIQSEWQRSAGFSLSQFAIFFRADGTSPESLFVRSFPRECVTY